MQPVPYNPTVDFSDEEAAGVSGRSTVRTAAVDTELSNIATTISQILTNLAIIQRDDGNLKDLSVNPYNLSASTLLLIGSAGFTVSNPIGWLTATAYAARVMVTNGTGTYVSVSAHTSGVFATDLAAGKWVRIFDSANYIASGVAFTPTGTIAATDVQAAIAEVALEALQKSSNLSDLVNAATARNNLALGVANSPTFTGLTLTGNASVGGTLGVTGVATFAAKPVVNTLTVSLPVFSDSGKGLASNTMTGTGNVVMSTSPTLVTPTLGAALATSINFGQTTLNYYGEGTWTPAVGGTATYTARSGSWTRVGRLIDVHGRVQINVIGTGNAGVITAGLPFAEASLSPGRVGYFGTIASNVTFLSCYVSTSTLRFTSLTAAAASVTDGTGVFGNGADVAFGVTYEV